MILQKITRVILTLTTIAPFLSGQVFGVNLEIKQKKYTYPEKITQAVTTETFVVTTLSSSQKALKNFGLITTHFKLNSATLLPSEKEHVLSNLRTHQVSKNMPLVVTGYTCQRGTDQLNQPLSSQRAEAVAAFLRSSGYSVVAVEGKGALQSSSSKEFSKNRRVEIQALNP